MKNLLQEHKGICKQINDASQCAHLTQRPRQTGVLVHGIDGHECHGRCSYTPSNYIGPVWEDVIVIFWWIKC